MAEVIDTLMVKLGLDNKEFEQKMDKSKKAVDDMSKSTDGLESAMTRATIKGHLFVMAIQKAIGFVQSAVNSQLQLRESLRQVARQTGQSIEDFQKWSYAVEMSGGSVESFKNTFIKLSDEIRNAPLEHNSTFLRGLNELGVSIHNSNGKLKSMSDLLYGLSGRLGGMSEGKALWIGRRLGLDDDTIRLLREGKDAVKQYLEEQERHSHISSEQNEITKKYRENILRFKRIYLDFSTSIGNFVIPIIVKLQEIFLKFINFFTGDFGKRLLQMVKFITEGLLLLASPTIIAHIAALGSVLLGAILPLIPVIAMLAAAFLLFDDIMTFIEGGDSAIGVAWEQIKKWASAVGDFFADIGKSIAKGVGDAIDWVLEKIDSVWQKIISVKDSIKGFFGFTGSTDLSNTSAMAGNNQGISTINNSTKWIFHGAVIQTPGTNGVEIADGMTRFDPNNIAFGAQGV